MRSKGWIIKVTFVVAEVKTFKYVGDSGRSLVEDRQAAHRWHYKDDAKMNLPKWEKLHSTVDVEEYP